MRLAKVAMVAVTAAGIGSMGIAAPAAAHGPGSAAHSTISVNGGLMLGVNGPCANGAWSATSLGVGLSLGLGAGLGVNSMNSGVGLHLSLGLALGL